MISAAGTAVSNKIWMAPSMGEQSVTEKILLLPKREPTLI